MHKLGLTIAVLCSFTSILPAQSRPPGSSQGSRAPHSVGCPTRGKPLAVIPFDLIGDHLYIQATINGSGPYRLIVDTGGVNLIDTSLVRLLSLKIIGKEVGHGVGPKDVESGETTIDQVRIGNRAFRSQKFYTFDLNNLYASGGVKMMGMVGAALFESYATCIDFSNHEIDLISPENLDPSRAGVGLPMSVKGSEVAVHGSFDGNPGIFQIDTGSPSTLTLDTPFVTAHNLLARFSKRVETSSGGVGGSIREYTVRGKDLVLGSLRIAQPITALAITSKGQFARSDLSGKIGNGALKRYVVTFDFPDHKLYLNPYGPEPANLDIYDRSGLRLDVDPAGFRVESVANGTPAAEAGIRVGDLIVTIDGLPANSISLPEMRDKLKESPDGSVFTLGVKAANTVKNVRLTLRLLL